MVLGSQDETNFSAYEEKKCYLFTKFIDIDCQDISSLWFVSVNTCNQTRSGYFSWIFIIVRFVGSPWPCFITDGLVIAKTVILCYYLVITHYFVSHMTSYFTIVV